MERRKLLPSSVRAGWESSPVIIMPYRVDFDDKSKDVNPIDVFWKQGKGTGVSCPFRNDGTRSRQAIFWRPIRMERVEWPSSHRIQSRRG